MQCTCSAHAVHMQCTCSAHAVRMRTLEDEVQLFPLALRHEPARVVRGGVAHELAARVQREHLSGVAGLHAWGCSLWHIRLQLEGREPPSRYVPDTLYEHTHTHIYIYIYLFADERRVRLEQLHRAPRGGVIPPRRVHEDTAHLVRVRARARVRVKVRVGIRVRVRLRLRARARAKARAWGR
eukprot:scaffold98779_cov65-Phaeocystis_antarctica.AAC.1